jgi:hypothetical protein
VTDGAAWQTPQFSPDGKRVLLYRFASHTDPVVAQLALLNADGSGTPIVFGPVSDNPQPGVFFSPDGSQILAEYTTLKTFWIFDANGQNGREPPFASISGAGATWQRLAP